MKSVEDDTDGWDRGARSRQHVTRENPAGRAKSYTCLSGPRGEVCVDPESSQVETQTSSSGLTNLIEPLNWPRCDVPEGQSADF